MKRVKVSALRERGLRPAGRVAEPQVVGLAPQTTNERRANTMKTYILRETQTAEPQKSNPNSPPPRPEPGLTALVDIIYGRPVPPPPPLAGRVLFIGLDVHNDSIAVSLAPSDSTEVRRYGIIGGEHDDVLKLVKKLEAAHPGATLKFCYEAGPRGFALSRCLQRHGYLCILVAPSKIPRPPGDRIKTNRRD